MRGWVTVATCAMVVTLAPSVSAIDLGQDGSVASVEVHGFASQGFILTTNNNYLSANSTDGSFQYSEIGLNFTKTLTDNLRMGLQFFAQNLGPEGSYIPNVDWFYLDYRWKDWLGFRAGRVKIPYGLYNDIQDVDSARVPVLLPQSVYPIENSNYLLAQTGVELYGYLKSSRAGALEYAAYGGTLLLDNLVPPNSPYTVEDLSVPYVIGGRLLWETPLDGLRVATSVQTLRVDATLLANNMPATIGLPAELWLASVEYSAHDLLLSAEYGRTYAKASTSDPTIFPPLPLTTSEAGYAMASYRVSPWFQPGMYYAIDFPNIDNRSGTANIQHDVAATLRFDINSFWLVKLEGHFMSGTAELSSSLNNNTPLVNLDRDWEVFLAKTTAYF
jgi:hypothetical protein